MESALISPTALTEEAGIGQPDSVKSTFITLFVVFVSFKQGYWLNNELPIQRNTPGTLVMFPKNRVCAIAARETERDNYRFIPLKRLKQIIGAIRL